MLFFLLVLVIAGISADDCETCVKGGGHWCGDWNSTVQCAAVHANCNAVIKNLINCPRYPDPVFAYDDAWARKWILPLVGAVYTHDPQTCLRNQLPTTTFYQSIRVDCKNPGAFCHAYTAYDTTAKTIMVSFQGTDGTMQWIDELSSFFVQKKPFFDCGNIFAYFYNAFYYLWNGGLEQSLQRLQYLYPDYTLVATGHSLGASICTVFASHVVKVNMWQPQNIKLITLGQPRTGDQKFSQWHDNTFPHSYRIVHAADPVPHVPPMGTKDEVFHHRYEVWYNNNMAVGSNFTVCAEADGPYCSNTKLETVGADHIWYYNKSLDAWPIAGCP